MLASVLPVSILEQYTESESLPGPPTCGLDSFVASALSLVNRMILARKGTDFTLSVYSVPQITSMSVPSYSTLASLWHRPLHLALFAYIQASSSFGRSPNWACCFYFLRVTGKMFLVNYVLTTARSSRWYLRCLLFSREIMCLRPASQTKRLL